MEKGRAISIPPFESERIIFPFRPINDATANTVIAHYFLSFSTKTRKKDIYLYINSRFGHGHLAMYNDKATSLDVITICVGTAEASGAASAILAAGAGAKRSSLAFNAEVMIHQVMGGAGRPTRKLK